MADAQLCVIHTQIKDAAYYPWYGQLPLLKQETVKIGAGKIAQQSRETFALAGDLGSVLITHFFV